MPTRTCFCNTCAHEWTVHARPAGRCASIEDITRRTGLRRDELTTLAKLIAGGSPGGAVVGRQDLLDLLDHQAAAAQGHEKLHHPGTFNANPMTMVSGEATLKHLTPEVYQRLDQLGSMLDDVSDQCSRVKGQQGLLEKTLSADRAELSRTEQYLEVSGRVATALEQLNEEIFREEIETADRLLPGGFVRRC